MAILEQGGDLLLVLALVDKLHHQHAELTACREDRPAKAREGLDGWEWESPCRILGLGCQHHVGLVGAAGLAGNFPAMNMVPDLRRAA